MNQPYKSIIPPLTPEEYAQLEANILRDGVLDPLIVRKETGDLLDGHNRLEIAEKHGLAYQTAELSFDDDDECRLWIIKHQLGRRNINMWQRTKLANELEDLYKPIFSEEAKNNQGTRYDLLRDLEESLDIQRNIERTKDYISTVANIPQNSAGSLDTRKRLDKLTGVSYDTRKADRKRKKK